MPYLFLAIAVTAEVIGTSALQASQQFTKPLPTLLLVVGYAVAFYFLGLTLRYIPVGVAYALWSGLGICLIAGIGVLVFGQRLDWPAVLGLGLIIAGIVVIQVFSKTVQH